MPCKDTFIVYRSFYEATKPLSDEDKLALFDAIFEFGLNHKESDLAALPKAMFSLMKPILEANHKRWLNGKKGGRPRQEEPKDNLDITEQEPNHNQEITKAEANKDKDKDKYKDKDKKESTKEKIERFEPNATSLAVVDQMGFHLAQLPSMIQSFKDQMYNRTAKFKDLQSCWRNYLRKGYVKPIEDIRAESFGGIRKTITSKQSSGNVISMTNDEIKQMLIKQQEAERLGCSLN